MSNSELIKIITELVKIFKFERYLYNISTIIAFLVLISCTIYLFCQESINIPAITGMFGSSGVIAFTCGRFLRMWSDAINLVQQHFKK